MLRRTRLQPVFLSVCSMVKPIGKPDAGNPRVRFDQRGRETERCRMAQATEPVLDSTIGSPSVRAWAECLNDDLGTASSQEADRPVWQLQRPLVSARQRWFRRSR